MLSGFSFKMFCFFLTAYLVPRLNMHHARKEKRQFFFQMFGDLRNFCFFGFAPWSNKGCLSILQHYEITTEGFQ